MSGVYQQFYRGRTVWVTGHTGFKGGWLSLWLNELGARVVGFGQPAPPSPNGYEVFRDRSFSHEVTGDVRSLETLVAALSEHPPEIVFHLAAQPLVRKSYAEPLPTLLTNAIGTANLLEALRQTRSRAHVVIVTTDKCYENLGKPHEYVETDSLGGHDIYSASKAAAELITHAWRRSFFEVDEALGNVATARGGNVIGGGDYAEDRLVPDCVRALLCGEPIQVRNPNATRPWQHVLDCLSGYLWLGALLGTAGKKSPYTGAFNFGPDPSANRPVAELVQQWLTIWPGKWLNSSPTGAPHEAALLNLNIDKAYRVLGWRPTWDFTTTVTETVSWYRQRHELAASDMRSFSVAQIHAFTEAARKQGHRWAGGAGA